VRSIALLLLVACGGGGGGGDGGADDAAGAQDAAVADAAPIVDAAPSDASPPFGVPCGPDMQLCTPDFSQGCCTADDGDAGCEPNFGLCLGDLQSCDGHEDCAPADTCCRFEKSPGCADPDDCVPDLGGHVLCHYSSECPVWAGYCCDGECAARCQPQR
jgi:hypothetical protein